MKHTTKLLSMTAVIALLSAPAMAHQKKKYDLDNDGRAEATLTYSNSTDAFTRIDQNHDGRVTLKEFKDNTMHDNEPAVFKMYDQNDDGVITRAELENNSKTGGQDVNSVKATSNLKSKSGTTVGSMDEKYYVNVDNPFVDDPELRNDVDVDIDNPFVDDPELANDVNWNWPKQIDRTKPLFPQIDKDNNGYLSQAEFMDGTMLENESAVFAMLDKNNSGYISKNEFNTYSKTGGKK